MSRRGAWGFPYTVDPLTTRSTDYFAIPNANQCFYLRVRDAGPISKIGLGIQTQSGNVSVGVFRNSGRGRSSVPGARVATSGAVSCPAVGYAEISLTTPCFVREGDWFGISADNTTAQFNTLVVAGRDFGYGNGRAYRQLSAHPLPATPSSLTAVSGWTFVLVGVQ